MKTEIKTSKKIKIIYIAGDGRSGSTILEMILANIPGSISVGECHRYWIRFYEGDTLCGCHSQIKECVLWKTVDKRLKTEFSSYDPLTFQQQVKEIQFYKNFKNIPELIHSKEWASFSKMVKRYYNLIAEISGNPVIIDSSKSVSWAYLLHHLDFCDLRVIHLERNLTSVANSWKKEIVLPEYYNKTEYMPIKSNSLIIKSWLKTKLMASTLRKFPYFFIDYETLCSDPNDSLLQIQKFIGESFNINVMRSQPNHGIGGNPVRTTSNNGAIHISNEKNTFEHLSFFEKTLFGFINAMAKTILR